VCDIVEGCLAGILVAHVSPYDRMTSGNSQVVAICQDMAFKLWFEVKEHRGQGMLLSIDRLLVDSSSKRPAA
jgi:hypothetical protein